MPTTSNQEQGSTQGCVLGCNAWDCSIAAACQHPFRISTKVGVESIGRPRGIYGILSALIISMNTTRLHACTDREIVDSQLCLGMAGLGEAYSKRGTLG